MRWPAYLSTLALLCGQTSAAMLGVSYVSAFPRSATAQDEATDGTPELEKATELKLNATSVRDLDQVVRLCEEALKKGLNEDSTMFAKQLLTGTLIEVAQQLSGPILRAGEPDPRWPFLRREAVIRLDRALELADDNAEAHLLRAQLLALPEGDAAKAKTSLDRAFELLANNPRELSRCHLIAASLAETPEAKLTELNKALELDDTNVDALRARALLHLIGERTDDALADFNRLAEIDATDISAQQAIAELLTGTEKFDEALAAINKAIESNPDAAASYMVRARIHMIQERPEDALADLSKAIELEPENIQAVLMRAEFNMEAEKLEEAKADIDRALILRPGLIRAILLRSLINAGMDNFAAAAEDMELLVANDPSNVPFQLQLALMYNADDRPAKAIEIYDNVLKGDPQNLNAIRGRADCMLTTGNHEAAVEGYTKCLEMEGDDDHVLNNLAWVLATSPNDEVRDGARSVELGLKACELTEYKEAHILSTLAAGYAETGNWEKAIEFSTKAVELARDEENRENLQKELDSYKAQKPWRELQERTDRGDNGRTDLDF